MRLKERLKSDLERDEGRIPHVYRDSEGYWTIGVGHLVDKRKGGRLPDIIIDSLLEYDIEETISKCRQSFPWFDSLDAGRQAVVCNMVFNLGLKGFMGFRRTIEAIEKRDWEAVSREMLDSRWARQVGNRASRLAMIMKTGE